MAPITEMTERQVLERVVQTLELAIDLLADLGVTKLMWDREVEMARAWLEDHAK